MTPAAEGIRREARIVGLRELDLPSFETVERRRAHLRIATATVLTGLLAVIVIASLWPGAPEGGWPTPAAARAAMLGISVAFSVYALEKEVHLRRLAALLVEERVLTTALIGRVRTLTAVLEASKSVNAVLECHTVPDAILRGALELLGASEGAVMLIEDRDELRAVCVRAGGAGYDVRLRVTEETVDAVAESREPLLVGAVGGDGVGALRSAMYVPLEEGGELLGALNVTAAEGRTFNEYDLRALSLFAEHAAGAISRARAYEAQRARVSELLELDRLKSEFVASVSHDLRTPLTGILGAAVTGRRDGVTCEEHREMLEAIERQARRLTTMIDELLTAAELDVEDPDLPVVSVDAAALVRLAAVDLERAGMPIEVVCPERCAVRAPAGVLDRIVTNLVTNAYKHGAPPVCVSVEPAGSRFVVSVLDHGPGVPLEHRARVFERFWRLDGSRRRPGLGLGLAIVRRLAEMGGGSAWVEDAPWGGAAFRVELPLAWGQRSAPDPQRRAG